MDDKKEGLKHRRFTFFDCVLVVLGALFVLAHLNPGTLNPVIHHISTYASSAPRAWMILGCMLLLGVAYWLIAFGIIRHLHHNHAGAVAALALAVGGALLFFVALYPTWTAGARQARDIGYWERVWLTVTGRSSEITDTAERGKVAIIHDQMIQTSIAFLVIAQAALAWALWREGDRRRLTLLTVVLATLGVTAFALSKGSPHTAGLWQRIGFVFIIAWMLWVGRRFVALPKREIAKP